MGTLLGNANLVPVAYAHVKADGTSPNINSGITTSIAGVGSGTYLIDLPDEMAIGDDDVLCTFVCRVEGILAQACVFLYQIESSTRIVVVLRNVLGGGNLTDQAFDMIIWRSVVPRADDSTI